MRETAPHPADEQIGEAEHLVGHFAGVSSVLREDEQRHCQHDEIAIETIEALAGDKTHIAPGNQE